MTAIPASDLRAPAFHAPTAHAAPERPAARAAARPGHGAPARRHARRDADIDAAADPLRQYLHEIGGYRLLTMDEEAALAVRIQAGDQDALDALVRANLRFVVTIAKKYQHHGVPLADLVNEGNLGLIRAARRFDPELRVKFISYAVWWVRQMILQALADQGRVVRVPLNHVNAMHRISRHVAQLEQRLGREPTPAEIADAMALREQEVRRTLALQRTQLSLDAPLGVDGDGNLLESLRDVAPPPDEPPFEAALAESIEAALGALSPREARILRLYFGFDGGEPITLEQIGGLLGITRERVRQIKERALMRLRHGAGAARQLRHFVD